MKDYTKEELNKSRPKISLKYGVDFCLNHLYLDTVHSTTQTLTTHPEDSKNGTIGSLGLSYEELIGVLLLVQDHLKNERESDD